jgi:hypothetical protein
MHVFRYCNVNQLQKSKSKPKKNPFQNPYLQQYNICSNLKIDSNYMGLKQKIGNKIQCSINVLLH